MAPFSASGCPHHHTGKLKFALGLLGVGHKVSQLLAQPNSLPHPQFTLFPWPFWGQRRDLKSLQPPDSGCAGSLCGMLGKAVLYQVPYKAQSSLLWVTLAPFHLHYSTEVKVTLWVSRVQ